MRVFAGPNGSGKTTIFKQILLDKKVNLGVYVNADDMELDLKQSKQLDFAEYHLTISQNQIEAYFKIANSLPLKERSRICGKKSM